MYNRNFNYSKLRGRIVEMVGSNHRLAQEIGITDRCMTNKMAGRSEWRQSEIEAVCKVLAIDTSNISDYFFAH